MKYLKILGITAAAVTVLMMSLGAGSAWAGGVLCDTGTNPCTSRWAVPTTFDFSLKGGTEMKLVDTAGEPLDACASVTLKLVLEANPDGNSSATGRYEEKTFSSCTWSTSPTALGKWQINATNDSGNGVLIADSETKIRIEIPFFGACEYGYVSGASIGTIAGETLSVNATMGKRSGSSVTCPETANYTGVWIKTTPATGFFVSTN